MSQSSNDKSRDFRESSHDVLAGERTEENKGTRGPWLVYVILIVIVAGIAAFLLLRPRGANAGGSRSTLAPSGLQRSESSRHA